MASSPPGCHTNFSSRMDLKYTWCPLMSLCHEDTEVFLWLLDLVNCLASAALLLVSLTYVSRHSSIPEHHFLSTSTLRWFLVLCVCGFFPLLLQLSFRYPILPCGTVMLQHTSPRASSQYCDICVSQTTPKTAGFIYSLLIYSLLIYTLSHMSNWCTSKRVSVSTLGGCVQYFN